MSDTAIEREKLEVDVLLVGGGPASLSCALHLMNLTERHNESGGKAVEKPSVLLIEKGFAIGSHILSGAVLDPRAIDELVPGWKDDGDAPAGVPISEEAFVFLAGGSTAFRVPGFLLPAAMKHIGCRIIVLSRLVKWLAEKAKGKGVEILEGVPGGEVLFDGDRVKGVRCRDGGVGKDGKPKENYMPGADIEAKVTIFGEGTRGSLARQLAERLNLSADRNPQIYATGCKELWEIPKGRFPVGKAVHTLGFPLGLGTFGGGFVYGVAEDRAAVGLVVGLDYSDPMMDIHREFQRWKTHPFVRNILDGGQMIASGAKTIPEGGYFSMPRLYGDGFLIVGDSAGMVNSQRLKGIHLAMKSGMLAAETVFECLKNGDFSERAIGKYDDLFELSWARSELYSVRNWRQGYSKGIMVGNAHFAAQMLTGGRGFVGRLRAKPDHTCFRRLDRNRHQPKFEPDGKLTFDKLTALYKSGAEHIEDQPSHCRVLNPEICASRCGEEFGRPCTRFCPASVYEWVEEEKKESCGSDSEPPAGTRRCGTLKVNFSNCLHCKTCDIKDPYENLRWTPPEGGGGPKYQDL